MRFLRKVTVVEWAVIGAIASLLALVALPDNHTFTRWELERRARNWQPGVAPDLADASRLAADFALDGAWERRGHLHGSSLVFQQASESQLVATFSTAGCLGSCQLTRNVELIAGLVTLDGAVAEYGGGTYDTLVAIRVDDVDYLLPATSVHDFERAQAAGSDDWRRYLFRRGEMPVGTSLPGGDA